VGRNYLELGARSEIAEDLLGLATDGSPFMDYFNFGAKIVDPALIGRDSFLRELRGRHNFTAAVLKMDLNSIYNWHVDDNRGVAVNMLLDGRDSHCIFTNDKGYDVVNSIRELRYKPERYYLFNTQTYHSVINFSKPRYLFSLEFDEDKSHLTYDQLVEEVKRGDYETIS